MELKPCPHCGSQPSITLFAKENRMNAYEYFIKENWMCALNIAHAQERNAKAEEIENLERKMGYFDEAVEALKKMEQMKDDLK